MRGWRTGWLWTGILLACMVSVRAEEGDAGKLLGFADYLFRERDYYRAITEYERFLFLYPTHASAERASLQIGMCYVGGGKWESAVLYWKGIQDRYGDEAAGRQARLLLAESWERMGNHAQALATWEEFLRRTPTDAQADAVRLRIGLAYLRLNDRTGAVQSWAGVAADSPLRSQADGLTAASAGQADLPRKSPALAAALSAALPGAGQLYVRRRGDALVSFVLNGLLIWGTVTAFDNGEHVAGSALGALEVGWYLGNVYNAASSAHKFNRRANERFFEGLNVQFGISTTGLDSGAPAPSVGVRVTF